MSAPHEQWPWTSSLLCHDQLAEPCPGRHQDFSDPAVSMLRMIAADTVGRRLDSELLGGVASELIELVQQVRPRERNDRIAKRGRRVSIELAVPYGELGTVSGLGLGGRKPPTHRPF